MKKTTSDKPGAYFNRITADHEELVSQLDYAQHALALARADYDKKENFRSKFKNAHNFTHEEACATREAGDQKNHIGSIESNVISLKSQIAPLHRIISAPERFKQAQKVLEELQAQKRQITQDVARIDGLFERLGKRIDGANDCIAKETLSASLALTTEDGFSLPECLIKSELELRLSKISQAQLQKEKDAFQANLIELTEAFKEAKRDFVFSRAVVAETQLYEKLEPLLPLFAKAAAARYAADYSADQRQWVVEIAEDLSDSGDSDVDEELGELL